MAHEAFQSVDPMEQKKLIREYLKKWSKRIGVLIAGAIAGGGAVEVSSNPQQYFGTLEAVETPDECAQPQAIIEGPTEADAGRLITLSANDSIGDSVQWDPINLPNPTDFRICGRDLICTINRPGIYEFRLWASNCKDGKPIFSKATHSIKIGGDFPEPPKPDEPTEPTEPDEPTKPNEPDKPKPGEYGLSEFALKEARKIEQQARGRADDVAGVFRAVANAGHSDVQKTVAETLGGLRSTLGADVNAWRDWYATIAERLDKLEAGGKMNSPEQFATAWNEIANGLELIN